MSLVSTAQEKDFFLAENGFSVSGSMNMFLETTDMKDITPTDNDARWHIVHKGDVIEFWIDLINHKIYNLNKTQWQANNTVLAVQISDGLRTYIVSDSKFIHLQIIEYEKNKWLVNLCSRMIE